MISSTEMPTAPDNASGYVFNIQRACAGDGPGLRTVVFLQGCPLRCQWCHNPESLPFRAEGARCMTVEEVLGEVARDKFYYDGSGGGMTLSGGEPMAQPDFAEALARAALELGIATAIETCGVWKKDLLRNFVGIGIHWLYDIKGVPGDYRKLCGVDAHWALANLRSLSESGEKITLRVPLVAGGNLKPELLDFVRDLRELPGVEGVDLLPYHAMGVGKASRAGMVEPDWSRFSPPPDELLESWRRALAGRGGKV